MPARAASSQPSAAFRTVRRQRLPGRPGGLRRAADARRPLARGETALRRSTVSLMAEPERDTRGPLGRWREKRRERKLRTGPSEAKLAEGRRRGSPSSGETSDQAAWRTGWGGFLG